MPEPLATRGITLEEWAQVTKELDALMKKNPFYSCQAVEGCYWCCPGLCLQTALCFCNPCTWCLYAERERGKDPTKAACNLVLNKKGIIMSMEGTVSEEATFSPVG